MNVVFEHSPKVEVGSRKAMGKKIGRKQWVVVPGDVFLKEPSESLKFTSLKHSFLSF